MIACGSSLRSPVRALGWQLARTVGKASFSSRRWPVTELPRDLDNSLPNARVSQCIQRSTMSVITVTRPLVRPTVYRRSLLLRSFRQVSRRYFLRERGWQFVIEALLFGIITIVSAWPIVNAVEALTHFLQRVPN
jgi:hypothetical protein